VGGTVVRIISFAVILTLIALLLPTVSFAEEKVAESLSLKALVQEARALMRPILEHNSSKLLDRIPESATVSLDRDKAKEKLLNLICNALVHAPAGAEIRADYNAEGNTFFLWVENKTVSQHMKREVVDTTGNAFNIEMFPGSGTLYSMALLP
jgi:signal transduction histidine kinase